MSRGTWRAACPHKVILKPPRAPDPGNGVPDRKAAIIKYKIKLLGSMLEENPDGRYALSVGTLTWSSLLIMDIRQWSWGTEEEHLSMVGLNYLPLLTTWAMQLVIDDQSSSKVCELLFLPASFFPTWPWFFPPCQSAFLIKVPTRNVALRQARARTNNCGYVLYGQILNQKGHFELRLFTKKKAWSLCLILWLYISSIPETQPNTQITPQHCKCHNGKALQNPTIFSEQRWWLEGPK